MTETTSHDRGVHILRATPSPLQPLAGVRVVEMCWVWSGPLFGQLLSDLGAEVIKCEWYKRFDPYRTRGVERLRGAIPEKRRRESSHSFHSLNRNKVGLAVDLKDEDGLAIVKDLLRESDLLIENFTVGTLGRLGLGADVLREINPKLVTVSLSGFGPGSRLEQMRAYGLVLSALGGAEAGITDDTGEFLGSPTFVMSDPNAALFGLFAAIAGIVRARREGAGGMFLCSQLEAIMSLMRTGRSDDDLQTWEELTVEATDGVHVAVAIPASSLARVTPADVRERATGLGSHDLIRELSAEGVAAAPVLDVTETGDADVFADVEVRLLALHPVTGPEYLVAAPWRINGQRPPLRKVAPILGEGDEYVLGSILGCSDDEVAHRRQRERRVQAPPRTQPSDDPGVD